MAVFDDAGDQGFEGEGKEIVAGGVRVFVLQHLCTDP
jgi:hypothetical protein